MRLICGRAPFYFCFLFLVLLLTGCGGLRFDTAQVVGIAKLDGTPLANVRVEFIPDPLAKQTGAVLPSSMATTDEKGAFRLRLADGRDGAVVGWHRVIVEDLAATLPPRSRLDVEEASETQIAPTRVPAHYRLVSQTPLRLEIKPGQQSVEVELRTNSR